MKVKTTFKRICVILLATALVCISGCGGVSNNAGENSSDTTNVSLSMYVGENGNWWFEGKDTGVAVNIYIEPTVGDNGNWWFGDKDSGIAVKQYVSPYVGTNGNWWYGFEDSGIPVRPYIGDNGNWWIGTEDTGVESKDIVAPQIGPNGNWWISTEDTGIAVKPHIGENGNWWLGEVDTGISVVSGRLETICQTHTDTVLEYLADDYNNVHTYAKGKEELSRPKSILLKCDAFAGATSYIIYLSENPDLSAAKIYKSDTNAVTITNLKIRTKYYYKFFAVKGGDVYPYNIKSFKTDDCPRMIDCEGVTNMRDIGGYLAADGAVKQGMIYRCGRLNTSSSSQIKREITDKGIAVMRDLGIKTEIDLRLTSDNEVGGLTDKSVLGEDINYYQCPMQYDDKLFSNHEQVRAVFAYLADESNYPVIYHCNIGTDRTGLISYLIEGLLGVKEEDIYRDYLFSNFGKIGGGRSIGNMSIYVDKIATYSGKTLSEKIENYLLSIGVTARQISSFKEIMLEPYKYYTTVIEEATCEHGTVVWYDCAEYEDVSFTLTLNDNAPHVWRETGREGDVIYFECENCGGKKTKDVTAIYGELPAGYIALEYIENVDTSYIDTGYKPNNNTRVIVEMQTPVSDSKVSYYYFGARNGGTSNMYCVSTYDGYIEDKFGTEMKGANPVRDKKYIVDKNGDTTIIDNEKTITHTSAEFQCDYSLYIFSLNNAGAAYSGSTGKLYSFIIYDNGGLVRYFIPCEYNGDVGLYDAVSESFYTDKTGRGFVAGQASG